MIQIKNYLLKYHFFNIGFQDKFLYFNFCLLINSQVIYERESVNRSQIVIKFKKYDIQTWKNIHFLTYPPPTLIHLSHRFTSALTPTA
jgi:hypothetical protein